MALGAPSLNTEQERLLTSSPHSLIHETNQYSLNENTNPFILNDKLYNRPVGEARPIPHVSRE